MFQVFIQAIDEFFDIGALLGLGCLFAAIVQVYVPTPDLDLYQHQIPVLAVSCSCF